MKNLVLLFSFLTLLISCENKEIRDPALQADIDNVFFKALDSRIYETDDDAYLIQGITAREALTLRISSLEVDVYELGGTSENYASFENLNGDTYYTNPNGSGTVIITDFDVNAQKVTGSFSFTAIIEGVDTIKAHDGIFFEAPYIIEEVIPSMYAGSFIAVIDSNIFNPFTVTAIETENFITITATTVNKSIVIQVPRDIQEGGVSLPQQGYSMSYQVGDNVQEATLGNLFIFSHNTVDNNIKGTFSFLTPSSSISLGQFNVIYD